MNNHSTNYRTLFKKAIHEIFTPTCNCTKTFELRTRFRNVQTVRSNSLTNLRPLTMKSIFFWLWTLFLHRYLSQSKTTKRSPDRTANLLADVHISYLLSFHSSLYLWCRVRAPTFVYPASCSSFWLIVVVIACKTNHKKQLTHL